MKTNNNTYTILFLTSILIFLITFFSGLILNESKSHSFSLFLVIAILWMMISFILFHKAGGH